MISTRPSDFYHHSELSGMVLKPKIVLWYRSIFFPAFLDLTVHKVQYYSYHFMILSTKEKCRMKPRPAVRGKKIFLLDKF